MRDGKTRLHAIRMIVNSMQLENQEDLLVELDKAGFPCGQATLSRDLKKLRISKVRLRNGKSVYASSKDGQFFTAPNNNEINMGKWSVQFSQNLMVLRTPPGHASLVAYDVDNAHSSLILGTVAGDDTIIAVLSESARRDQVLKILRDAIPSLKDKLLI